MAICNVITTHPSNATLMPASAPSKPRLEPYRTHRDRRCVRHGHRIFGSQIVQVSSPAQQTAFSDIRI
jgi:hypothetical protein